MCSICLQVPCHPACPNAPEQKPVMQCSKCGDALYVGEKHYEGICERCLEEMDASEWLELFGEKMKEI